MSVLLSKILSSAIHPLNFALYLLIASALVRRIGFRRIAWLSATAACAWLWFWSTPYFAEPILMRWEQRYPTIETSRAEQADLILVLGGGIKGTAPGIRAEADLGDAADRVWAGARLYREGKAPKILVSGGTQPWLGQTTSEADGMSRFLTDLGVPADKVVLESDSQTTYENAVRSAPIIRMMGAQRVLLVTSAFHMQRSLATHQTLMPQIEWIPFSTDVKVVPRQASLLQWLPSVDVLESSQQYLRERVGIWVYRYRGWL